MTDSLAHKSILNNMVCLIENKKNSSARFKALLKTYIVDVEADDYSA